MMKLPWASLIEPQATLCLYRNNWVNQFRNEACKNICSSAVFSSYRHQAPHIGPWVSPHYKRVFTKSLIVTQECTFTV